MSHLQAYDYKDHWCEEEVILQRTDDVNSILGFTIAGGVDEPYIHHKFTSIIIIRIIQGSIADQNRRLKLFDIILNVNGIDFTNIEHETAVNHLKRSGHRVQILVRRLSPLSVEKIQLSHHGKLGIQISGGMDIECIPGDHGVFISDIFSKRTDPRLRVGDRLLQISSRLDTYDLRFVTHAEANRLIRLARRESKKIELCLAHGKFLGRKQTNGTQRNQNNCADHASSNESPILSKARPTTNTSEQVTNNIYEEMLITSTGRSNPSYDDTRPLGFYTPIPEPSYIIKQPSTVRFVKIPSIRDLRITHWVKTDEQPKNSGNLHTESRDFDPQQDETIHDATKEQRHMNSVIQEAYAEKKRREESKRAQEVRQKRGMLPTTESPLRWQVDH